MQDQEKGLQIVEFCNKSFHSVNQKVIYHTSMVLFNYLLCYERENKKHL